MELRERTTLAIRIFLHDWAWWETLSWPDRLLVPTQSQIAPACLRNNPLIPSKAKALLQEAFQCGAKNKRAHSSLVFASSQASRNSVSADPAGGGSLGLQAWGVL